MGEVDHNRMALLITGTLVPNSSFVAHTNVEQRRREYMAGLLFYRQNFPHNSIFFLENSSHSFDNDNEFRDLLRKEKISLIKLPVSDKVSEGKGYQEFQMLDKAVDQLKDKFDHFMKITGRYHVQNIQQLIPTGKFGMVADSHKKYRVTQTNVFFASTKFYSENLSGLFRFANDTNGKFIEHVVYNELKKKDLLRQVSLFERNPIISGFSGSYGGTLNRNKYKMKLRNIERAFLRACHIHEFLIEY